MGVSITFLSAPGLLKAHTLEIRSLGSAGWALLNLLGGQTQFRGLQEEQVLDSHCITSRKTSGAHCENKGLGSFELLMEQGQVASGCVGWALARDTTHSYENGPSWDIQPLPTLWSKFASCTARQDPQTLGAAGTCQPKPGLPFQALGAQEFPRLCGCTHHGLCPHLLSQTILQGNPSTPPWACLLSPLSTRASPSSAAPSETTLCP